MTKFAALIGVSAAAYLFTPFYAFSIPTTVGLKVAGAGDMTAIMGGHGLGIVATALTIHFVGGWLVRRNRICYA